LAVLALFQFEPYCSRECGAGVISALSSHHTIEIITRHDLNIERLSRFDMVIFPGGRGDASDFQQLLKTRKPVIQSYLDQGGTYLGICMGAYWADSAYFDLIGDARCVQYITQPKAEIRRSFPTTVRAEWNGKAEKFYFFDGCAFVGSDSALEIHARYANGDPMAVVKDKVGLIGCHLESELDWYTSKEMKASWHGLSHHRLLAEFVDDLLRRRSPHKMKSGDLEKPLYKVDAEDIKSGQHYLNTELDILKKALQEIEQETSIFTQGTLKKINEIARRALRTKPNSNE
jgi:hypothetical protein